jgi:hypothetical protein
VLEKSADLDRVLSKPIVRSALRKAVTDVISPRQKEILDEPAA